MPRSRQHLIQRLALSCAETRADLNYEYPVRPGVAVNSIIAGYGKLNADTIPLSKIADHKKAAANLVDKVGFDN